MQNDAHVRYEGTILSTLALRIIFIANVIDLIVTVLKLDSFRGLDFELEYFDKCQNGLCLKRKSLKVPSHSVTNILSCVGVTYKTGFGLDD
jgi:hypothetical protein